MCLHWQGLSGKNVRCLILLQSYPQGCLCSQSHFWVISWWLGCRALTRGCQGESQCEEEGCLLCIWSPEPALLPAAWLLLYSLDLKPFCSIWGFILLRCATYICKICREQEIIILIHSNNSRQSLWLWVLFFLVCSCFGSQRICFLSGFGRIWFLCLIFPSQISCQLHAEGKILPEK